MKKTIKDFLFKRRFKVLKNKKGFSLLEVLIAVGIIAIISSIAIPQFTANRNEAAKVAGDTSMSNILKAFNSCIALKSFAQCNSLNAINVTCPDCKSETSGNKFCSHIKKSVGGGDFSACVSIDTGTNPNTIYRSYGGTLLQGTICHSTQNAKGQCSGGSSTAMSPVKTCSQASDCGTDQASGDVGANTCFTTYQCTAGGDGECNGTADCT